MNLHIGALAADFRTSSLRMRDTLYLEKDRLRAFFEALPADTPLLEIVALCTCNRIELYYVCKEHTVASEWLSRFLADFHGISFPHINESLINYRCEEAVRHLFRVAAGAESMVFGEHEILGQIRDAYFYCFSQQATDSYLNRLFQQSIAAGKKVRSADDSGQRSISLAEICALSFLGFDCRTPFGVHTQVIDGVIHMRGFYVRPGNGVFIERHIAGPAAAPACAGIPVTHRSLARSAAIVTGHLQKGEPIENLTLPRADTIVFLMQCTTSMFLSESFCGRIDEERLFMQ